MKKRKLKKLKILKLNSLEKSLRNLDTSRYIIINNYATLHFKACLKSIIRVTICQKNKKHKNQL